MVTFIVLAYAFSWTCFLAYVVPHRAAPDIEGAMPYLVAGQFGPSVAAVVLAARTGGRTGVARLLRRLLIVRFPVRWWVVVGWSVGLVLLAVMTAAGLAAAPDRLSAWLADKWRVALLPLVGLLAVVFGAGPLGEELGWRGYLQPRLIDRWRPLRASVVLGIVWAFWHLPLFFIAEWREGLSLPLFIVLYPVSTIAVSHGMFIVWKNSRGSVAAAVLLHGTLNAAAAHLLPDFLSPTVRYLAAVAAFVLWALLMQRLDDPRRPANPYAAAYRSGNPPSP